MDGQPREVRFHDLERNANDNVGRNGVKSRPAGTLISVHVAANAPASRRDSEADALSHVPPMYSPKLRRSITPEEHENLVEQQLLQWRQHSRQRQHELPSADQKAFSGRRSSYNSGDAPASPSRVATSCSSADSPSTTVSANLPAKRESIGVFHEVSAASCRPRKTVTVVAERASSRSRQQETRDSKTKGTRRAIFRVVRPVFKGNLKTKPSNSSQNHAPGTPVVTTVAPDSACPSVGDLPQYVILPNDVGRSDLGVSHKSGDSNGGAGGAPVPPEQPRPVKRVRFKCDPETEKRRTGPPARRQRLVSVPLQVIRAQLELHASLQSQVDRLQFEMHQQRLEQRQINAGLIHCIKEMERKNAELYKEVRGQRL